MAVALQLQLALRSLDNSTLSQAIQYSSSAFLSSLLSLEAAQSGKTGAADASTGSDDAVPSTVMDVCYNKPSFISIFLGCFLMVGTVVSYIPQYLSIFRAKSSDGLSYVMLGLSLESSCLTAINSGILLWGNVTCCAGIPFHECVLNNMPTEQLSVSLLCYLALYAMFIYYFDTRETATQSHVDKLKERRNTFLLFVFIMLSSIALGVTAGVLYYNLHYSSNTLTYFAYALGIMSAVCMILMWSPQIYTTWKKQDGGALSPLMLMLQLPGAVLVVIFQGFVNQGNWTTWLPYVFNFIQMAILLGLLGWIEIKKRKQRRLGPLQTQFADEHKPLLDEVAVERDALGVSLSIAASAGVGEYHAEETRDQNS